MKSSSCTQPFTKYICPVSKHKKHKTFLCLLSPSFKNCRFEKNAFKVDENGTSKNVCKLSNKDSDFIG